MAKPVCRYFFSGTCRFGDTCRFSHTPSTGNIPLHTVPITANSSTTTTISSEKDENNKNVMNNVLTSKDKSPVSSNGSSNKENTDTGNNSHVSKPFMTVCRNFAKDGQCRHGDKCWFSHDLSNLPGNTDGKGKETGNSKGDHPGNTSVDSERAVCAICFEVPDVYGLLIECDHAVCLECIKTWRKRDGTKTIELRESEVLKACPVCRLQSSYVVPSNVFATKGEAKTNIIDRYKSRVAEIPCRYFKTSRSCPFGDDCLYAHKNADGTRATNVPRRNNNNNRRRRRDRRPTFRLTQPTLYGLRTLPFEAVDDLVEEFLFELNDVRPQLVASPFIYDEVYEYLRNEHNLVMARQDKDHVREMIDEAREMIGMDEDDEDDYDDEYDYDSDVEFDDVDDFFDFHYGRRHYMYDDDDDDDDDDMSGEICPRCGCVHGHTDDEDDNSDSDEESDEESDEDGSDSDGWEDETDEESKEKESEPVGNASKRRRADSTDRNGFSSGSGASASAATTTTTAAPTSTSTSTSTSNNNNRGTTANNNNRNSNRNSNSNRNNGNIDPTRHMEGISMTGLLESLLTSVQLVDPLTGEPLLIAPTRNMRLEDMNFGIADELAPIFSAAASASNNANRSTSNNSSPRNNRNSNRGRNNRRSGGGRR